jgi:hypothetical protein
MAMNPISTKPIFFISSNYSGTRFLFART